MITRRYKRLLFRILYYPSVLIIKPFDLFFHKAYCRLIYTLLKQGGVNFTGFPNYISSDVYIDDLNQCFIGHDCVISKHVVLLTHDYSITTALKSENNCPKNDVRIDGKIIIGNNVFIGLRSTILPDTKIGNNVIIGAGSVVKGSIPDNSVAAGNPCRVIMSVQEYLSRKKKIWSNLNLKYDS